MIFNRHNAGLVPAGIRVNRRRMPDAIAGPEIKNQRGSGGFTLIELMVVLGLIAIMTGVVVSEMSGTREDAILKASARKVIDVLNLASSRSITLGQTHRVQFEVGKHRFEVRRKVHEPEEGVGFVSLNDATGSIGEWDERIQMEFPKPETAENEGSENVPEDEPKELEHGAISFYPDGTADPFRMILRDRQGYEIVLQINPATGRVKVKQFERQ